MAIAFGAQAASSNGTTTQVSHTVSLSLSAGDLVVVLIAIRDDTAISSVTGSVNATYTAAGTVQYNAAHGGRAAIYYFENSAAGSETVTVTTAATSRKGINVSRWTGAATSSALDQNNGNNNASGTAHNAGAITTTGAGLVITSYISSGDEGTVTQTGFTALTVDSSSLLRDYFGYRIVTGSTAEDGDFTCVNSVVSAGKIASFNEAAAGGDPEGSLIGGKLIRGGLLMHGVLVR